MRHLLGVMLLVPTLAWGQFLAGSAVNRSGVSVKPITAPSYQVTAQDPDIGVWNPLGGIVLGRTDGVNSASSLILRNGSIGVVHADPSWGSKLRFDGIKPDGTAETLGYIEAENNSGVLVTFNSALDLTLDSVNPVRISAGLFVGSGQAITGSFRGTSVHDVANLVSLACETWTFSVPGVVVGGECVTGIPTALDPHLVVTCHIDSAGVIELHVCNLGALAVNPASATYSARSFNP